MRTIIRDNYTPKNGDYHEKILIDEAQNKTWIFDCDGVFTPIPTPVNVVDEYGPSTTDAASQRLVTETMNTASEAIQAETEAREAADRLLQEEIEEIEMSSDVVDIVGTHAELEQYDTQHLKDNDIIKVLRDETRQNQTTYYRWSTSAQDFTYVGAEGPYYTESQVDNLLSDKADKATTYTKTETDALLDNKVDKVAGKGLSANDFTDSDKSKLDGIEAGAEANVQSDWDQTDNTADDYIKNKPTLPTDFVGTDGQTDGAAGLVPAPLSTDAGKYLKADGTWDTITIPQSGIPTTATFWGASYDSVNNKVAGLLTFISSSGLNTTLGASGNNIYLRLAAANRDFFISGYQNGNIAGFANSSINLYKTVYMYSQKITDMGDPTAAQDAATKNYVDTHNTLSGASAPTTSTVGYVGQFYLDTTNDQMYYLSSIDDTVNPVEYTWETVGGSSVNVVQTVGTSTTDVMSQDAVCGQLYGKNSGGYHKASVMIGDGGRSNYKSGVYIGGWYDNTSYLGASYNIIIGDGAGSSASESPRIDYGVYRGIAIGGQSRVVKNGSIALGFQSVSNREGELSVGSGGSGSYRTRYIANVKDPANAQDAATKNYVDTAISGVSAPTYTPSEFNNLWENA